MKRMASGIAVLVVLALAAVMFTASASSTPVNWKTQVKQACNRELLNATWTRKAVLNGNYVVATERARRLGKTIAACRSALADMP